MKEAGLVLTLHAVSMPNIAVRLGWFALFVHALCAPDCSGPSGTRWLSQVSTRCGAGAVTGVGPVAGQFAGMGVLQMSHVQRGAGHTLVPLNRDTLTKESLTVWRQTNRRPGDFRCLPREAADKYDIGRSSADFGISCEVSLDTPIAYAT